MLKRFFFNKENLLRLFALSLITFLYFGRSFNDFKVPFIKGDGLEYVLMTEAFHNHLTSDIKLSDLENFKARFMKYHKWEDLYAREGYDALIEYYKNSKNLYKEASATGFYCNKNGKWICQHFWFYSLVNLPAYVIGKHFGPLRTFYLTNAFLVIIVCIALLFFTPFSVYSQILSALCFCFSCCYWYLGWQHTEVFTSCFVALSLIVLFNKKYYTAIILLALACLQNQPLTLLLGLYCLIAIHNKGLTFKNILKIGLAASIALIPPVFYYINFETTNLIKDAGFLDTKYITVNRVTGFYTDFSQGMILTIPLILLLYVPLIVIDAWKMFRKQTPFDLSVFIPLIVLVISITVSTMGNWNHGMAIINRYATWLSIVVMIHTFYLTDKLKPVLALVTFNYFFVMQCFTTLYHQQFNEYDWSSARFTPLAKWALRTHETLYNPDPVIFAGRIQPNVALIVDNSPIIYFHKKLVKKVLVHRDKIDELSKIGLSNEAIKKIKSKIHYNYDWGYVPMKYFKSSMQGEEIYYALRKRKVEEAYKKIFTSTSWMDQIKIKAQAWGKTFEEACWIDAEYVVAVEEQREEKD